MTLHPGTRVVTAEGTVRTVAFTDIRGQVWVFDLDGSVRPVRVLREAWGDAPALAA